MAMISGQAPNTTAQTDCQVYQDFASTGITAADGQLVGQGCVFPIGVNTVADQLQTASLTWHAYMEDMTSPCLHPTLNSQDTTQSAEFGNQYAARHNPFVYFQSIIDTASCTQNDVPLTNLTSRGSFAVLEARYGESELV